MSRTIRFALFAWALLAAGAAPAALVDFNDLPGGDAANPYSAAGATFTTTGGFNVIGTVYATPSLCASPISGNINSCALPVEVAFDGFASAISFTFTGNNEMVVGTDIGDVALYSGATLLGTVDMLVGDTISSTSDLVNLAGYAGVTRMVLTSTDFGGILYDDFRFTLSVPEPASWAMMIGGFALVGASQRRRTTRRTTVRFA